MSMSMSNEGVGADSGTRRVVVVGGGVAGSIIAKSLQFHSDLTLIDSKEYFEIPYASLRLMVEPSFGSRTLINHKDYLSNTRIIVSKAINISSTEVLTEDGHAVPFDYLVIATGHYDHVPVSTTGRLKQCEEENEKIKAAQSILIVGGGPVGVELAGEIVVDYPDKHVTLVHKGSRLLEFMGPKASEKTLQWLRKKNVDVKLEQYVNLDSASAGNGTYETSAGDIIKADCHFLCTGKPVGSAWLKDTILKDNLDRHGRLMVDGRFRVKGHGNIFAIGDITDIQEMKQGYIAAKHASVAAKNVKMLMKGATESKLAIYKSPIAIVLVSLGRREGLLQLPFLTTVGCIPGSIKSKDMFVGKVRKDLGLDPDIVDSDE